MKNSFGKLFSSIRKEKGYSLKETAENIVSVQFLRKFEKGESDIKLSNFHMLLNRINTSYEEFMFAESLDSVDYAIELLEKKIDKAAFEKNAFEIGNLINQYTELYEKTCLKRYFHFSTVLKSFYNQYYDGQYYIDMAPLIEYLLNCEAWGKYEFFLVTYSMHEYETSLLKTMATRVFNMNFNKIGRTTMYYLADFFLHIGLTFITRNEVEYAKKIIILYKTQNTQSTFQFLDITIFSRFLEGLIFIKDNQTLGIDICEEIIAFFADCIEYKGYASRLYNLYFNIYSQSDLYKKI